MCAEVYILFSRKRNKFYTGFTSFPIEIRHQQHLDKIFKGCFTSISDDWEVFLEIKCESVEQGLRVEKHIKKMKSKTYINNLKKYPDMVLKLLTMYRSGL